MGYITYAKSDDKIDGAILGTGEAMLGAGESKRECKKGRRSANEGGGQARM